MAKVVSKCPRCGESYTEAEATTGEFTYKATTSHGSPLDLKIKVEACCPECSTKLSGLIIGQLY